MKIWFRPRIYCTKFFRCSVNLVSLIHYFILKWFYYFRVIIINIPWKFRINRTVRIISHDWWTEEWISRGAQTQRSRIRIEKNNNTLALAISKFEYKTRNTKCLFNNTTIMKSTYIQNILISVDCKDYIR